jgi:hypothetical protein
MLDKLDRNILYREYITNNKSSRQIGEEYGCCKTTIMVWLRSYDIPIKPAMCYKPNIRQSNFIHWSYIVGGAKKRNVPLTITRDYSLELYHKQGGRCALTGVELKWRLSSKCNTWTASLDRIDSTVGYVSGNVQWVHRDINRMKWDLDEQAFIDLCTQVADHQKK